MIFSLLRISTLKRNMKRTEHQVVLETQDMFNTQHNTGVKLFKKHPGKVRLKSKSNDVFLVVFF
jgi:hypothetical protein